MIFLALLLFQDIAGLSGQGAQAMRERRFGDAARIYRELAVRDSANPMWHFNLGLALQSTGEYQAALIELGVFLRERPAPGPAHLLSGMAQLKLNQHCEAIVPLEKARQWQQSAQVMVELGDAYHGCQRWEQAAQTYQAAAKLSPADKRLPRQAARCWWLARQYTKARPLFASIEAGFATDADFNYEFGDTLVRMEGAASGLKRLEKAVAAAPGLMPARAALGKALMDLNRAADALPHLEMAAPEDPALLLPLSRAYKATGRAEDAARTEAEYKRKMSGNQN